MPFALCQSTQPFELRPRQKTEAALGLSNLLFSFRTRLPPWFSVRGQVVGESTRQEDIVINLTKSKKLTNMRASGSDDKVSIAPPVIFSLEEALEYIKEDEYVEVTPKSIRLRKIVLNETERKRQAK